MVLHLRRLHLHIDFVVCLGGVSVLLQSKHIRHSSLVSSHYAPHLRRLHLHIVFMVCLGGDGSQNTTHRLEYYTRKNISAN